MARTTLDIDASVLEDLRRASRRQGKSMGQVASEALAVGLAPEGRQPPPFEWIAADLGEPLVDLEDKDAVWEILDRPG